MSYGLSTRAVTSPIGVKQRFSKGVKYVPLSKFFLDREKEAEDDDDEALYGREEPKRDKDKKTEACQYDPQKCMYCDAGASRALVFAGGQGYIPCCPKHVNKGAMRIWRTLKDKIVARRRIPLKHKLKEGQSVAQDEGMTSTGTVATTAVPIGPGIRHTTDILDYGPGHPYHEKSKKKRRKRKKSPWANKIANLLRRVV